MGGGTTLYDAPVETIVDATQVELQGYIAGPFGVSMDGSSSITYFYGAATNGSLIIATNLGAGKHLIRITGPQSNGYLNGLRLSGGANTASAVNDAIAFAANNVTGVISAATSPLKLWGTLSSSNSSSNYGGTFIEFGFTGTDVDLAAVPGEGYAVSIDGGPEGAVIAGGDSNNNNTNNYIRLNTRSLVPGFHTVRVEALSGTTNNYSGVRVLNGTRLSSAVASSSTSISVDSASHYSVGDWIMIDYYANREFRKITAKSGNTLTIGALTYDHPQYTSVSSLVDPAGSISASSLDFPTSGKRIVAIGDSNTHAISPYGVAGIPDGNGTYYNTYDPRASYLSILSKKINVDAVNLGIQGTDSNNQLGRANDINTYSQGAFDDLLILEGTNDINGNSATPAQFKSNVQGQIDTANTGRKSGGKVILMPLVTNVCQTSGNGLSVAVVDAVMQSIATSSTYSPYTIYAKGMLNGFDYNSNFDATTNPNGDMYGGSCSLHFGPGGAQLIANNLAPLLSTTGYTISGPSSGSSGQASTNFTITRAASTTWNGVDTITISDGSNGGTFTPSVGVASTSSITITPTASTTSFTYTYTPASVGTKTLTMTNAQNWTDPSALSFTSSVILSVPIITTQAASSITQTSALLNGIITADGNASTTVRGFNIGLTTAYTASTTHTGIFNLGSFSTTTLNLIPNTLYHYRV